jgi:hypothetical protein
MNEQTSYDPAARFTERYQNPSDPQLYPDVGHRAALALGAFFLTLLILGVIALWNRSPYNTSSTATAPATGAPAPAQH